ncbi:MAG: glucuronosyltransferase [Pannonibacter phragmitetus]|uniref:Oligosaccharide biosynthesis protein Alg14 like n=1 Tax=Pannonibacter phragmitetus TaxID=121719 RepID=A0A379A0G6_9HYPH|nr:hypothetical protein [Pannonibacter phragmitetus]SUB02271.1 Oligosaccharide biosynthesis protein Alg14 like [Pannonibacter phragmitetus]
MTKTVLAISSSGGHWEQLMLLREAFAEHNVVYANTLSGLAERNGISGAYLVGDCNRDTPLKNLKTAAQIFRIIWKHKPDVIISTGAAPGIIAIAIGRMFRARTIWIDSIANSEKLSMSGKIAGYVAHLQLTQWEHLARENGPRYAGSVL